MTFLFFRRFVALFLLISVSGLQACSPVTGEDTEDLAMSEPIPPVEMVLSQIDKAKWKLDLKIPEKEDKQNLTSERVMIFSRSSGDYRAKRFKHLSGEASLKRVGGFDTVNYYPLTASRPLRRLAETLITGTANKCHYPLK